MMNSFRQSDRKGACHIYAFISRTNVTRSSAFLESLRTILALVFSFIFDFRDQKQEEVRLRRGAGIFLVHAINAPSARHFPARKGEKQRFNSEEEGMLGEKGTAYSLMPPVGDGRCEVYMNLIRGL